jgi:hypothetical protein
MRNEAEDNPQQQKQQPGKQAPTGLVNTPDDTETNPSPGNQSQSNAPQNISKKNPSQDTDSQPEGQEKPEIEKRRAS